jgi:type IV secretory pathway TrbL component
LAKPLKSVGKGELKSLQRARLGEIVLSVALGAFLGPMATGFLSGTMGVTVGAAAATGISAGIGVFGSSLLAGDGFKNSLRNGLTAGALSFGVAGVTQGFSTPATNAPANFAQGYEQGLDNITSPFRKAADFIRGGPESSVGTAKDFVTQPAVTDPNGTFNSVGDVRLDDSFGPGPPR